MTTQESELRAGGSLSIQAVNEVEHEGFRQYADWWLWALETLRGSNPRLRAAALTGMRAQARGASVASSIVSTTQAFRDGVEDNRTDWDQRTAFLPWRATRWLGYGFLYAIGAFFTSVGVVGLSAGQVGTLKQLVVGLASLGLAAGTQLAFFWRRQAQNNLNTDVSEPAQRYAELYARASLALRLDLAAAHELAAATLPRWKPGTDISTVMGTRTNTKAVVAAVLLGAGIVLVALAIFAPATFWWAVIPAFLLGVISFDAGRSARNRIKYSGERGGGIASTSRNLGCLLAMLAPAVGIVLLLSLLASVAFIFGAPYTCAPNCP